MTPTTNSNENINLMMYDSYVSKIKRIYKSKKFSNTLLKKALIDTFQRSAYTDQYSIESLRKFLDSPLIKGAFHLCKKDLEKEPKIDLLAVNSLHYIFRNSDDKELDIIRYVEFYSIEYTSMNLCKFINDNIELSKRRTISTSGLFKIRLFEVVLETIKEFLQISEIFNDLNESETNSISNLKKIIFLLEMSDDCNDY